MPHIAVIIEDQKFRPQVEYTFRTLFSLVGCTDITFGPAAAPVTVYFGNSMPAALSHAVLIRPCTVFWGGYCSKSSLPEQVTLYENSVPVIYAGPTRTVRPVPAGLETDLDLIASAFFMLSRYEEYLRPERTEAHGRFPATASFAHQQGFLEKPVVNMYARLLKQWVEQVAPGAVPWRSNFWAGRSSALCMTHDVDTIAGKHWYDTLKDDIKALMKGSVLSFFELIEHCVQYLSGHNPADTFGFLQKTGARYGVPSTYFFMSHKRHAEFDVNEYTLTAPKTGALLASLKKNGHEVGLHGSYNSYDDRSLMNEEVRTIAGTLAPQTEIGIRQHFLRQKNPDTWQAQAAARVLYDSSIGYADHEGFRAGICHPFQLYDLEKNEALPVWEIPLIWMEGTLINYRKKSEEEVMSSFRKYMDIIAEYNGIFTVLWHNATLSHRVWRKMYAQQLGLISQSSTLPVTMTKALKLFRNHH